MIPPLVDSHCHIDTLDRSLFDNDSLKPLEIARSEGVVTFLCVCIDIEHFPDVLHYANSHSDVYASVGLHPNVTEGQDPTIDELVEMANHPRVVAIGETGLDYYRSEGELDWQRDRFARHIKAARQTKKPIIVHTRQARKDTIDLMRNENASEVGGIMHCFTEDWDMAKKALDLGFYISFSGIITFKNAKEIRDVARQVPLDRILIETDCPYLAPVPHRGEANQPAYVKYVAECLAKVRDITFEEMALQTTKNFNELFHL